ncbi:MAG: hypothetical protein CMG63_04685 [Candidatus Marinimicrobia bacterium]|nr:hypothetical protein [Candidatus Neomarinimicrobiota bacterium]
MMVTDKYHDKDFAKKYHEVIRIQRETHIYKIITKRIKKRAKGKVLDLGCGTGLYFEPLLKSRKVDLVVAIDPSAQMVEYALKEANNSRFSKKIEVHKGVLENAPHLRYNTVLSIGVLGTHTEITARVINEILIRMDRGGRLLIVMPDGDTKHSELSLISKTYLKLKKVLPFLPKMDFEYYVSKKELNKILRSSNASLYNFTSYDANSHCYIGELFIVEVEK